MDLTSPEHPYYASLGAVSQFTDDLLGFAYRQQRACDPLNKPYYLDCLLDIARGRNSSDLQIIVAEAQSVGELGQQEIENAYKFFTLDPANTEGDDHIIGVYKSRIEASPLQKDDAKKALKIIADARSSEKIRTLANDNTMKYKEALEYLGVTDDVDLEVLGTLVQFKVSTSPHNLALSGCPG